MPKHELYDFIVAKAANVDLVVFEKVDGREWKKLHPYFPEWFHDCEYFLCLPQLEEACLHWLNGGDVMIKHPKGDVPLVNVEDDVEWFDNHIFMTGHYEIHIKPETEGRWIAYSEDDVEWFDNHIFMTGHDEIRIKPETEERWIAYSEGFLGVESFETEEAVREKYDKPINSDVQFIKITVEKG